MEQCVYLKNLCFSGSKMARTKSLESRSSRNARMLRRDLEDLRDILRVYRGRRRLSRAVEVLFGDVEQVVERNLR